MSALSEVAAKVAAEVEGKAPEKPAEKPEKVAVEEHEDNEPEKAAPVDAARAKLEADARTKGWRPKEEWDGDPDDWVSAKLFMKRGEEIEERKAQREQAKRDRKAIEELSSMVRSMADGQKKREAEALLAKRDQAIESGNKAAVHQIEQEISHVMGPKVEETPAAIKEWTSKHSEWWGVDPLATQAAVAYYGNLEAKDRTALSDNLEKTEKYIKKRFPDLFPEDVSKAAEAAQAFTERKLSQVSVPRESGGGKSGPKWADLPENAKRVGDDLVRRKIMTREEYLTGFYARG